MTTRQTIVSQGIRLEYLTIGWNCMEAVVAMVSGLIAGSIALVGFGIDSVIEVSSGAILLWRLGADQAQSSERAEHVAVRLVGAGFLVLATYVTYDALSSLVRHEAPEKSVVGIVLAILSLIVMPMLAHAKRRVALGLGSGAMRADSRQTDICAYLSAILLGGLVLNALFGWWWADPVAGLIMVPLIAYEGIEAVQGKTCCAEPACGKELVDEHRG
ncbi:MAG TPA: cation transporter [Terriglobales bacterium]|nr:cation transporter [Terriglobales bacterium]